MNPNPQNNACTLHDLVGRPLVPFFTSEGVENTNQQLFNNNQDFSVNKKSAGNIKLRQFKDGEDKRSSQQPKIDYIPAN
jgi:hypothetical protein